MIITCQECESSFNINDEMIKETGSKVKCSKCENVFVVYPPAVADETDFEEPLAGLELDADDVSFSQDDGLDEDLGLPDLDAMFDEDQESAGEELTDDLDLDAGEDFEADDLDLDIGEDLEAEEELPEQDERAETDLPDLESIMDFDEDAEAETLFDDNADELELDLDEELTTDDFDDLADVGAETDESELDLLDSGNLLDEDAALETEGVSGQLTDELELDVDSTDMDSTAAKPDTATDELDLSDLEDLIDADQVPVGDDVSEAVSDDLDLEIDMEAESVESADDAEQVDELDLSDLEDTVDTAFAAEATEVAEGTAEEPDLELEFEEESGDAEQIDELDLSDLEEDIDTDVTAKDAVEDLDLELDLEAEAAEPSPEAEAIDELDFSDLEDIAESDETPALEDVAAASAGELPSDLELDFQVEDESQIPAEETTAEAADELDFSDLGKMLAEDETPVPEAVTDDSLEELDLDFDVDLEPETASPEKAAVDALPEADDEEFLDIEKMLEESGEEAMEIDSTAEPQEFDLDLDSALEEQDELDFSDAVEDDLEFNLLESDEAALQEKSAELESSDFRTGATTAGVTTDGISDTTADFDTDEFSDSGDFLGQTDMIDSMPMPKKQRSVRKPLTVFALFLILVAGILIVPQNLGLKIPFLSDIKVPWISDIKIPYLSDKFKSQPKDDAGSLMITPLVASINYQFVDNSTAGTLFVIQGRVKNEYDHPRSFIRVTGKVYQKGNVLAKTATVYGGNLLSEKELANLDMTVINNKLQNKFGQRRSNVKVKTGMVVPFMIVFDKVPVNLDEYTVEVAGSAS